MSYIHNDLDYKKIILNTDDANVVNTGRTEFIFNDLKNINIKKKSYLKYDCVTANIDTLNIDKIYTIKVDGLNYNKSCYYNTDKNGIPTILSQCFNGKSSTHLNNFALELVEQDIPTIKLIIKDTSNAGLSATERVIISLMVEEVPEPY